MFKPLSNKVIFWRGIAKSYQSKVHIDSLLGRYKSDEFINLVKKWVDDFDNKKILKTDLREEAFGEDEILFSLSKEGSLFFALDIAEETTQRAYIRQKERGFTHKYITADVRNLPFKDNIFDAIVSSSTLDHFSSQDDLVKSLLELKRVVNVGGNLIITLNNKFNINFYLMLKLEKNLGRITYPVQFYSIYSLRKIIEDVGLSIQATSYIVHIVSPSNSILLLLRRYVDKDIVDKFTKISISLFKWLGNRKMSQALTGWFIALKCTRK